MARFIVACVLVAGLCIGGVLALGKMLPEDKPPVPPSQPSPPLVGGPEVKPPPVADVKPTDRPMPAGSDNKPATFVELPAGAAAAPMVLLDARIMAVQQQNVPAQRDGMLLFLGTEIESGEFVAPEKVLEFDINTLAIRVADERSPEWAAVPARDRIYVKAAEGRVLLYRPVTDNDNLMESETAVLPRKVRFRTLDVGDRVVPNQMLGVINPVLALAEVRKMQQKVEAAQADVRAASAMVSESNRRSIRDQELYRTSGGRAISKDDVAISKVTFDKYREEEQAKIAGVKMAQAELAATFTAFRQHIVRANIPGVIRQTYKQPGEAVKNLDPVLQIQNPRRVRVDAQVDVQDSLVLRGRLDKAEEYRSEAKRLWLAALGTDAKAEEPAAARELRLRADRLTYVDVEASHQEPPVAVLSDHGREVTCVAVTRDANPRIVSGSEDGTVRVWGRVAGEDRWVGQSYLDHGALVRALAVTGPKAERNLMLTGTATGRGRIFNLDDLKAEAVMLEQRHTGPITAVAFNEDGTMCVTGGDDASLCLWDAKTGELFGRVPNAHRTAVTSVEFTKKDQVVSAGRDKRLTVWNLGEGGVKGKTLKFDHNEDRRGGEVAALGVDPAGENVVIDDEKELRVQSLSGRKILGSLRNPAGSAAFGYFARFAPDGKTILTGSSAAGRLQLWRAPSDAVRPSELRHYLWSGTATCASFDPAGKFAVTGTADHKVLVWKMPDSVEVEKPLPGQLTFVEEFLDVNARKLTIRATVENPGWVIPGASATVVVPPLGKGR